MFGLNNKGGFVLLLSLSEKEGIMCDRQESMSEEGDIFTDLLSGLMPHPAKPEVNEEDNVEALVAKPASMNELRSSKHQGENGEMVDVKRSSSPIGVGLAPPPPPLTKYGPKFSGLF